MTNCAFALIIYLYMCVCIKKVIKLIYANLKAEMVRKDISAIKMAKSLNISPCLFDDKMRCLESFTIREVRIIMDLFPECRVMDLFHKSFP